MRNMIEEKMRTGLTKRLEKITKDTKDYISDIRASGIRIEEQDAKTEVRNRLALAETNHIQDTLGMLDGIVENCGLGIVLDNGELVKNNDIRVSGIRTEPDPAPTTSQDDSGDQNDTPEGTDTTDEEGEEDTESVPPPTSNDMPATP